MILSFAGNLSRLSPVFDFPDFISLSSSTVFKSTEAQTGNHALSSGDPDWKIKDLQLIV